jgi:hypothetical protein
MGRFDVLREIERLDPERDHARIVHLSFGYEFPWDSIRALEVALYRTYCVPSISRLLDRTGEFHRRPQRGGCRRCASRTSSPTIGIARIPRGTRSGGAGPRSGRHVPGPDNALERE